MTSAPKKAKPERPHRARVNFYVDDDTIEVLDNLVSETPELENRSAAFRYVVRVFVMTAHDREA